MENDEFRKICARFSINWGDRGNHKAALGEAISKTLSEFAGEIKLEFKDYRRNNTNGARVWIEKEEFTDGYTQAIAESNEKIKQALKKRGVKEK